MAASYLDWLTDLFEEAQVPYTPETADYLDLCLRRIARLDTAAADEEAVFRALRDTWLRNGPPGKQLLASLLRSEVYSRRDSPMRPHEGVGYYVNPTEPPPRSAA